MALAGSGASWVAGSAEVWSAPASMALAGSGASWVAGSGARYAPCLFEPPERRV